MPGRIGGYPSELVRLGGSYLACQGRRLAQRMSMTAEFHRGTRSVLEYLLSPVQNVA